MHDAGCDPSDAAVEGVKRLAKQSHPTLPVGLLIRNKRRELGLSQDDLARQLGVAQGSISKLERGLGGEQHAPAILAALKSERKG